MIFFSLTLERAVVILKPCEKVLQKIKYSKSRAIFYFSYVILIQCTVKNTFLITKIFWYDSRYKKMSQIPKFHPFYNVNSLRENTCIWWWTYDVCHNSFIALFLFHIEHNHPWYSCYVFIKESFQTEFTSNCNSLWWSLLS